MTSVRTAVAPDRVTTRLLTRLTPAGRKPASPADAPFSAAAAVAEHVWGVLPLLYLLDADRHPAVVAARAGDLPTALAVFTPNAELAWSVPPVRARWQGGRVVLSGRFRVGFPAAAALVTAVTEDGATVLCLVTPAGAQPGWVELTSVEVQDVLVSSPLSASDITVLTGAVDDYAWVYAGTVQRHAARMVADLRRALASTVAGSQPLSASQYLAHELTRLDIELSMLGDAARSGAGFRGEPAGGQAVSAVLAACTDLAYRTAAVVEDFTTQLGLPPPADVSWSTEALQGHFGGRRMAEAELARRMGLLTETAAT